MAHLNAKAAFALISSYALIGIALFVPAGTLDYPQAWFFLAVFGASTIAITAYLMRNDPQLLEHRLRGGPTAETSTIQRVLMWMASTGFIAIPVISGFDRREHWSSVVPPVVVAGFVLIIAGLTITFLVVRENPFASATIELAADQRVISSGPYALVRHPMYSGGLLYLVGMPLALGSYWAFIGVALIKLALVYRLLDEEQMLAKSLPGYAAYLARVKYRLFPGIW